MLDDMPYPRPLSEETLRALRESALHEQPVIPPAIQLGWWAMLTSWALSPPGTLHCISTELHFVACGGPGWADLGYDPLSLAGKPWVAYIANSEDVARSTQLTHFNASTGRGFTDFENSYKCADGGTRRVRWSASPWYVVEAKRYAVARGVIL